MKLIQVLRLILKMAPDGEIAEVIERVIAYMEVVDRILDLLLELLPVGATVTISGDHPKVEEMYKLLSSLENKR